MKVAGRPLAGELAHRPVKKKARNCAETFRGHIEVTVIGLVEPAMTSTRLGTNDAACCSRSRALIVQKLAERRVAAPSYRGDGADEKDCIWCGETPNWGGGMAMGGR